MRCLIGTEIDLRSIGEFMPEELKVGPEKAPPAAPSLPTGDAEKHLKALLAALALGDDRAYTAVVLPADHRCASDLDHHMHAGTNYALKSNNCFGGTKRGQHALLHSSYSTLVQLVTV